MPHILWLSRQEQAPALQSFITNLIDKQQITFFSSQGTTYVSFRFRKGVETLHYKNQENFSQVAILKGDGVREYSDLEK